MQEQGPKPTFNSSLQAYSQVERVLRQWASDRDDVVLLSQLDIADSKSVPASHQPQQSELTDPVRVEVEAPHFLLYLSPRFKVLAQITYQITQEFSLCFDGAAIRTFCQGLQKHPQLSSSSQKHLEQILQETWSENSPEQHSQFSLALLQHSIPITPTPPQSQALLTELQEAWEAVRVAEHAKQEFMALVSHELRTPLTSVIGMSATMLRWAFGPLNDRQRDCIQTIHRSGEHLMQMIESILDLSQTASGQASLNVHPFSLQRLIKHCVQLFQTIAEEQGVHLRASHRFTSDADDTFMGDSQRLQQIVVNLLDNAIKFTETDGTVRIQLSREQSWLKLEVKDTGIGISPKDRDRLFQRFQQLENSHRRRFGGTGLGLALTKQIVDLHGGRIEIESHLGQGSCFTVWLPEQQPPATGTPAKPQGEVVLLEEDDLTATLVCELLNAAGYKVVWLVDSSTALEQIQMLRPVAAIVNLQFQGSGGEELVQHVHRLTLEPKPKIIGLLPQELREGSLHAKAGDSEEPPVDAIVYTPLNPEELVVHLNPRRSPLAPS